MRVGVHWSVLAVFALIALGLAGGRLPEAHPGRPWPAYAAAGVAAAVVFLASLLAHELAHAVAARRDGVPVDDVVLWLLGGATRLRDEAPSPAAELRISGSGPLVSLLLGVGFFAAAWLMAAAGAGGLAVESVVWLSLINVLLALFNVVPASPLDGGRLLRALLWWRTGDRLRAAARASAVGRGFGWALVALGLWAFVWTAAFGGLWLALIGWFLVVAATEEGRQARLRQLLAGVAVRETMTPDPETVDARLPVDALVTERPPARRHTAFPVTGADGGPVGLVTVEEAARVPGPERARTTVGQVMAPLARVVTAEPGEPVADLLPRLGSGAEHRAVVVDGGRVAGIVSPSDISRVLRWRGGPA